MEFGTKDVFDYIKENLTNPSSADWYDRVYAVIKADTLSVMASYCLQTEDRNDIIQTVQLEVNIHLVKYIINSEDKSEGQRNAWLKKIVKNKITDFFRRKYKMMVESLDELLLNPKLHGKYASSNEIDQHWHMMEVRDRLLKSISKICEINTSPAKIISFFVSRVIGTFDLTRKNGSPQAIVKMFNGKSILEASQIMKKEIQSVVSFEIPDSVYSALDKKVNAVMNQDIPGDKVFSLSARAIADSSSWITGKLRDDEKNNDETNEEYDDETFRF